MGWLTRWLPKSIEVVWGDSTLRVTRATTAPTGSRRSPLDNYAASMAGDTSTQSGVLPKNL